MTTQALSERDQVLGVIFQEGREGLTAVEALSFLDAVTGLARKLEAVYVRQCNGYHNDTGFDDSTRRRADEVQEPKYEAALRAHFEGAGLGMTLQGDPRGSAVGIATPKTGRFNTMGGREAGWKLDVEALTGRTSIEEETKVEAKAEALAVQQRKTGDRLTIGTDVLGVLEQCRAEGSRLFLPAGRLDRDLYAKTDAALKLAGGKWNRSAGAHVFQDEDAADVLDALLTSGEVLDRKTALQAFYTPAGLASRVVVLAGVADGDAVLEPSAGGGAIALAARMKGGHVRCVEVDAKACDSLAALGFHTANMDFLSYDMPVQFDRVVMNPPFTRQQDARHVLHASRFLKPGGRLVAIMSPSAPVRTTGPGAEFLALVRAWGGTFEAVDAGAFKESGTSIATVILTLNRPEA